MKILKNYSFYQGAEPPKPKNGYFKVIGLFLKVDGKMRNNLYFRIIGQSKQELLFIL
jgi:hypothetical protein